MLVLGFWSILEDDDWLGFYSLLGDEFIHSGFLSSFVDVRYLFLSDLHFGLF